jgi:hypothetical protein
VLGWHRRVGGEIALADVVSARTNAAISDEHVKSSLGKVISASQRQSVPEIGPVYAVVQLNVAVRTTLWTRKIRP